jgi:hypothetical protein
MSGLSVDNPTNFADALRSTRIAPGDHVWMLAGRYTGDWVSTLVGTAESPIIIEPYGNGPVIIDGSLNIQGAYTQWIDLDFTDSRTDRTQQTPGVTADQIGTVLAGCSVADMHSNGVNAFGPGPADVLECALLNNGYVDGGVNVGHAIYAHNNYGGARRIGRCAFFDQLGKYTIHIYSTSANALKDFIVTDNLIMGDPMHDGGGLGLSSYQYQRNVHYQDYAQHGRYSLAENDGVISDNVMIDQDFYYCAADLTQTDNLVYGGLRPWPYETGYTLYDLPELLTWWIPYTESRRWAGMVGIYNRDSASHITIDMSGLANGDYLLRNAQNLSETWAFTWTGSPISVSTAWTSQARIGGITHPTTWPVFGALIVERA